MRAILQLALAGPLAVLLSLAIGGAFVALLGALAGLENVTTVAGTVSGLSASGFFVFLLSPLGELLGLVGNLAPRKKRQTPEPAPKAPTNDRT
jgi:hypothetical protein